MVQEGNMVYKHTISIACALLIILMSVAVSGCSQLSAITTGNNNDDTAMPTPGGIGLSRHNPIPLGTTAEFTKDARQPPAYSYYNIGSDVDGEYSGRLTVLEVKRGSDAEDLIRKSNPNATLEKLDEGQEFMVAKVKFELIDMPDPEAVYRVNSMSFDVVTSDGRTISQYFYVNARPTMNAKIYEGATDEGWITLACARDDPHPLLVFENKDGRSGIWFDTQ